VSVVVVCSAKSGAVTTTALGLAGTWPGRPPVVLAELDPSGGELASWYQLPHTPGLLSWAAAARDPRGPNRRLADHVRPLPGGVAAVLAPPSARAVTGALDLLVDVDPRPLAAASHQALLIGDCGRLDPHSPARWLLAGADLVLVVARPQLADVAHLADWLPALPAEPGRVRLLLAGDGPYRPAEISAALGVPVLGVLPHDPRGAAALGGVPSARAPRWRLPLVAAAGRLATALARELDTLAAPPRQLRHPRTIDGLRVAVSAVDGRGSR
jgi:hypothetical protein